MSTMTAPGLAIGVREGDDDDVSTGLPWLPSHKKGSP